VENANRLSPKKFGSKIPEQDKIVTAVSDPKVNMINFAFKDPFIEPRINMFQIFKECAGKYTSNRILVGQNLPVLGKTCRKYIIQP
jgi:hypothetical protein